jgi:hypothetical protein
MAYYGEYTTVTDVRSVYVGTTATGGDALYLDMIRDVSREIDNCAGGRIAPEVQTRYYDAIGGRSLDLFDAYWQEISAVVNGDGTTLSPTTGYDLHPYTEKPINSIRLKLTSGLVWLIGTDGNWERAISVSGVTSMHPDYTDVAWRDTGGTVINAPLAANGTSLTIATGVIKAGYLLKLGSGNDFAYASAVSTGGQDTVTLVRGVNGSTGIAHPAGDPVYRFYCPEIDLLARECVVAKNALRLNPVGEQVVVNGYVVHTPKDVVKYMAMRLNTLGIVRRF